MKRIIALLTVAIFVAVLFGACSKPATPLTVAELLDLGEKYLLELDYEQAVVQFLKVIEVEPMNPRGYTGAAEAYLELGDITNAEAILKQGTTVLPRESNIESMLADIVHSSILAEPSEQSDNESSARNPPPVDPKVSDDKNSPINFTGKEPFIEQDLLDWDYPPGLTMWDVQSYFEWSTDEINEAIEEVRGVSPGSLVGYFPDTFIVRNFSAQCNAKGEITAIYFRHGNFDKRVNIIAPRGVEIGMPISEVISLFAVENPEAILFASDPCALNDDESIDVYSYIKYTDESDISLFANIKFDKHFGWIKLGYHFLDHSNGNYGALIFSFDNDGTLIEMGIHLD